VRRLALLAPLLLAAACGGPRSPYVRIMADDGRVYYTHEELALHSPSGGFLTFRDLVTREQVQLKNGTYRALECPPSEVDIRQREYLDDPTHKPVISDYEPEPARK
jgi:hypothetical protein